MPDSCEAFEAGFPRGLQCLELFIDGKIALDCSDDPDGYRQVMDILTRHDVIWRSDASANQPEFDGSHPFVWNYHRHPYSSNGRAMTRTCDLEDFLETDSNIITMTAQEMLKEILTATRIAPLDLDTIYTV